MCVRLTDRPSVLERSAAQHATSEDAIIQEYDGYIRTLAYQFFPRQVTHADVLDLEIDELIQTVRIKLWEANKRQKINNYKAYIRSIVHNEAVNYTRRAKFHQFLETDEEGEPYSGNVLLSYDEGTLDPLDILVERETVSEYIQQAVDAVVDLPPLQQKAILCVFKERIDYLRELLDALRTHHIDLKQPGWSGGKKALHSMRVSASLAKKKLKALRKPL